MKRRDGHITRSLDERISESCDRLGLFYRTTHRVKSERSMERKKEQKNYVSDGPQMQDLYGVRVTVFFPDDVHLVTEFLKERFGSPKDVEIDEVEKDRFCARRTNLVFRLPRGLRESASITEEYSWVDETFEVQVRTILSEGWHEVEHDFRYKGPDIWSDFSDENRIFNGVLATLETAEWSILKILEELCYGCYKDQNWADMFSLKLRLRIEKQNLDPEICSVLDDDNKCAKRLYKLERSDILHALWNMEYNMPLRLNNIVHYINWEFVENESIRDLCPPFLKSKFS